MVCEHIKFGIERHHAKGLCRSCYLKARYQLPSVKAYFQNPKRKAQQKKYRESPRMKKYMREYHQRPDFKEYRRKQQRERYKIPEIREVIRAKARARYQIPEFREYMRKYQAEYNQRPEVKAVRDSYMIGIKFKHVQALGGKCSRCGYDKSLGALHLHHKDRSEKEGNEETQKEIIDYDKFILLCANCHAEEHWPRTKMEIVKERISLSKK
jgi:hypothetical protein